MYPIILKLLIIKGHSQETIQATLNQYNPADKAQFLNGYLDNEERTIAHKLGILCVDDNTFTQWTDYVKQCKDAGYTNAQIIETLEQYAPTKQLIEVDGSLRMDDEKNVQNPVQEVVQTNPADSEYNFDYADKKELDDEIKRVQAAVAENVYKLSLLKDKTKQGPYINESYLDCPSYKNMIPQIQNVIVEKRRCL